MADKENNSPETIGSLLDSWDIECMNLDEKTLEKLKKLPERMDDDLWDKI